jgi:hypothetical protein
MNRTIATACGLVAACSVCAHGAPQSEASAQRVLVDKYCVGCHNQRTKVADLALDKADVSNPAAAAETWEKVIGKLRSNAMPPPGLPRPDKAAREAFVQYLETSIDRAAAAKPNPGRTVLHRLNRAEYSNAIRDLLGIDVDSASLLPADDSGFGFDNIADVLSVSPMLTERYLSAARRISRLAVGDPTIQPATDVYPVNKLLKQDDRASEDLPFGSRAGLAVRYYFPVDGDYVVKIFLLRTYDGKIRGTSEPHQLDVRVNGEKVRQFTVGAPAEPAAGRGRGLRQEPDGMEVRFTAKAGPAVIGVTFVKEAGMPEGMLRPKYPVTSYEYAGDVTVPPAIANVEIRGPYDVRGPGSSPSRERIFVCHQGDDRCARQILSTVARRAYRRPVTSADLAPLMGFYQTARDPANRASGAPNFDAGIEMALQRILVSPDFLFRVEQDPAKTTPGTPYRISDLELASRLSFFLWSSIPDEELLEVASRGQLKQPATLEKQVRRMLADDRSKAWIRNFTGQWLYLRNIELAAVDPYAFPNFDANLRDAFAKELELFLDSQVQEDHGVAELLTADYTYLNERLAQHYGIPNIYGSHFRRVTLAQDGTDDARKGLLGKGGILMVTSFANRTSPVKRGKWLLENILGAPPPPPLPNVPSLKENAADGKAQSVRERLEEHRANPACAGCHKLMDPLGFALENFDAVGQWRVVSEAGTQIDASGELTDGTKVDGPATLRNALLAHREDFAMTVTEKLLTYALGRGAEYFDKPAIRQIVRGAGQDYKWSSLILGITRSAPFQMRMPEAIKNGSASTP